MSEKRKVQSEKFRQRTFRFPNLNAALLLLFTFHFSLFTFSACSVPNLEKPECTAARLTVKEFYSYHFGNDMKPSAENLQKRAKFLSDALKKNPALQAETQKDYFTSTDDYPKAFRIGECAVTNENTTVFQVVLFWKNDERNEQREVKVEAVKENEKWLINRIF